MAIAHSKITSQGQISVPAQIRRKLGVGPGAVLEWEEKGEEIIVRRARRYTCDDLHAAAFGDTAVPWKATKEFKEGIRQLMRKRYARD